MGQTRMLFMKNLYATLLCLLVATLLGSCTKSDESYVVCFSENGVVFDGQGGTKSVEVTTLPEKKRGLQLQKLEGEVDKFTNCAMFG